MDQIDEIQSDSRADSETIIDILPSSKPVSDIDIDHTKIVKNASENQQHSMVENSSQDCIDECTNNLIEDALSKNEYNIPNTIEEIKNENDKVTENLTNAIKNDKQEAINNDTEDGNNQPITNEECKRDQIKNSVKVKDNWKCIEDVPLSKNSTKSLSNAQEHNINEDEHNVCAVLNIDTTDDTNAQCQALIKTLSETFEDKEQSLHVTDTDTDLSKFVDGNSEVMVLTVETVPINDSNGVTEENIVLTVHEKDNVINPDENDLSIKEKEIQGIDIVSNEFNLIDYTQESEGTIIEVISTEIVQSEIPEKCEDQCTKEVSNRTILEIDSAIATTLDITKKTEVICEKDIEVNKTQEQESNINEAKSAEQIELYGKGKTEICDSEYKSNITGEPTHNIETPPCMEDSQEQHTSVCEMNVSTTKRSVIQDIFDDWVDENADDDKQSVSKVHDTVEIKLKSLLNETKTETKEEDSVVEAEEENMHIKNHPVVNSETTQEAIKENMEVLVSKEQPGINQATSNQHAQNTTKLSLKEQINISVTQSLGKSAKDAISDSVLLTPTLASQVQTMPVANRTRNFTSQIASPAEVTEALKERLREKQKIVDAPLRPDIFFVKKLTQRLSSKLAGSPAGSLPALLPLAQSTTQTSTHSDMQSSETATSEINKESNSDNKELLAILEGDVDPDWSNLKPPILTEEGKRTIKIEQSGYNTPPKLDPLVEREIALKQLLELPVAPVKRSTPKKKKAIKLAHSKVSKEEKVITTLTTETEVVNINLLNDSIDSEKGIDPALSTTPVECNILEKHTESNVQDIRLDESRSGRKRKLTEKAREHEQQQNIVKRHKVCKGKLSISKKQSQENESSHTVDISLAEENRVSSDTVLLMNDTDNNSDVTIATELVNKHITNNNKIQPTLNKPEHVPIKSTKQNLSRKGSQSIAKRSMVVKKILRQNMPSSKQTATLKAKLTTSSKKTGSRVVAKSKRSTENNVADSKPKKKIINEIDRLLQDEGVVNLLYDVEQPVKKRLVPITKSQTKVMDLQKVQRELKLRKKLVRNAVLRLRTSTTTGASKVSPRSKRTSIYLSDMHVNKKIGNQTVLSKPMTLTSQEFIVPAKIRNAADASVIIRRHSSSSFSSASGSPRVSIDSPEKNDGTKVDEGGFHSLRSTKRRYSQEEKVIKKNKKRLVQKNDTVEAVDDKVALSIRPNKKLDSKKIEKSAKQAETDEICSTTAKVITRSNGTTAGKITSKTKKSTKNKVTFAKMSEPDNNEEFSKGEDELSACLAEAANALAIVSSGNKSAIAGANRKNKSNLNNTKMLEMDNNKSKMETRSQFSNKEINVRRHGNLVQLILTPSSSSTKIRNALSLQMMQEFRETLAILKKDDDCRVVLLTSTGSSFCEGLELSMLLHSNKEERRIHAVQVADAVKDFIKCLASFNKPIVAGVQGVAIGLGVTMLPLFDLVIASDKATFSTPYGKLGQIAEGAAAFTLSHILGSAITSELLLGGRTLTASEALRAGLVTRVLWPDRFQVELLPTLKVMSEQSSQSMEATKALLRHSLRKKLDAALESETYLLIQHWCSVECQTAIKAYIDGKVQ